MSLKKRVIFVVVFAIILSTLAVFGEITFLGETTIKQPLSSPIHSPSATTTLNPTPTEISSVDYNAEAQRLFNQAVLKIEQIRNVTVPRVNLQVVTKDWSIQTWGVSVAQADLKGITRQENIYKSLLMLSQNDSLYQATVDWAGYFMAVVQSGKIYIVKENFNITNTIDAHATMVHELTHLLQNTFNIPQYYYSFDGGKARTALIEGDATFTASYIKNQTLAANTPHPEPNFSVQQPLMIINNANGAAFFPSIPDSVYNLDYFPYKYGEKFLQILFNKGGWATINQAYQNPPNSTEQILHPEKYFTAELPLLVEAVIPLAGNWTKTWGAQYGEFFIQNMLSTNLTRSEAEKAAAGWGGDKLTYYENSDDHFLITWNIKWDTYNDAGEFFLAFNNYMKNAGAQEIQFSHWETNQIHQKINWDQTTNTTLIIASTEPNVLPQFP